MTVAAPPPERIHYLARRLHSLGVRPIYELLLELRDGADLWIRLERYAGLAPLAGFIASQGGDHLPPPRALKGGRNGRH
jgi:hypothetical protein